MTDATLPNNHTPTPEAYGPRSVQQRVDMKLQRVILGAFWHRGVKAWRPWLASEIARRIGDKREATASRLAIMERSGVVRLDKLTKDKNAKADTTGVWEITAKGISLLAALDALESDDPQSALRAVAR